MCIFYINSIISRLVSINWFSLWFWIMLFQYFFAYWIIIFYWKLNFYLSLLCWMLNFVFSLWGLWAYLMNSYITWHSDWLWGPSCRLSQGKPGVCFLLGLWHNAKLWPLRPLRNVLWNFKGSICLIQIQAISRSVGSENFLADRILLMVFYKHHRTLPYIGPQ